MAITAAKKDAKRLAELIDHMENLPRSTYEQLLEYFGSDAMTELPEPDRLGLWTKLVDMVAKHKRFPEAPWAMKSEQVEKIAMIAKRLAPDAPSLRHQRLFSDSDFLLYERNGDYEEQSDELETRRQKAIEEIATKGGVQAVLEFATTVKSPLRVGIAFGVVAKKEIDHTVVLEFLKSGQKQFSEFTFGFILSRFRIGGWQWVDDIDTSRWSPEQISYFLSLLPFTLDTWKHAKLLLGENESAYWSKTDVNPYSTAENLTFAIDQLIRYGRPFAAIRCLQSMLFQKQSIDSRQAIQALLAALSSTEKPNSMDSYQIIEVIKYLQDDPSANPDDLFHVEWAYLSLLDRNNGASPKFLERKLSEEPLFFCEVIRVVFRSNQEESVVEEPTEEKEKIATNAYRLLSEWKIPPGLRTDGLFDGDSFASWIDNVKRKCSETGHLQIALTMVGHVLIHVPPDPDGLWIDRSAADTLNMKDSDDMREGFRTELFNTRGAHFVDPTGKPERELADKYKAQAEAVEAAGYSRLATTLRELSVSYVQEAKRIFARENIED